VSAIGSEGSEDSDELTSGLIVNLGVCLLGADPDDLLPRQGL
jgi:hypothetical protein